MKAFIAFGLVGLAAAMPRNVVYYKPSTTNHTNPTNTTGLVNPSDSPFPPLSSGVSTFAKNTSLAHGSSSPSTNSSTTYFTGIALRSGSDIHDMPIAASGSDFWIGKPSTTYTPAAARAAGATNSSSSGTVFAYSAGASTLALAVSVPGGQSVYVAQDGAVQFTVAHSANTGNGSTTGFTVVDGALKFEGNDFIAIPAGGAGNATYQVYAASRSLQELGQGFVFYADPAKQNGAWEYI
ncbi:hypothetical protein EJ03DRAFT_206040 [Teratosphaeria nubilosa]|uniref:Uncharacterized protein n=1 Tax=Teratosphaeria nubilosa TaxID=161662 RepID=A0A6G1KXY5_9PEZI|nr:hypothetical protein EJ03DRAFT_206040 [Teratosphaeria nubilosa]